MRPVNVTWTFERDGAHWHARTEPPLEENLLHAVETFVAGLGTQSWKVQDVLDIWDQRAAEHSLQYSINLVAATLRPIDEDTVELRDKYKQFQNVQLPAAMLRDALHSLMAAMDARSAEPK